MSSDKQHYRQTNKSKFISMTSECCGMTVTATVRNFKVNILTFFNSSSQRNCFHCSVSYINIIVLHQIPSFFSSWYVIKIFSSNSQPDWPYTCTHTRYIKAGIGLQSPQSGKDHPEVLAQIFLNPIPALWQQLRGNGWEWCSFT